MIFPHLVEHVVMLDARNEQLGPVIEKNARSNFSLPDGSQVLFQQRSVAPCLLNSPR